MRSSSGVSKQTDTSSAVEEAVEKALAGLGERRQLMAVMVFAGADYDQHLVATTLERMLPGVPSIGCTTDGEISSEGLSVDSVCVMLMASQDMSARAVVVENLSRGSFEAGVEAARLLKSPQARALILLPDGLTGNGSAIIRGAQEVMGKDFVIAGGTAGDRGRFQQTWQYCNGRLHTNSVAALMLESKGHVEVGFGVMSGWQPMGIAKEVTRSEANVVFTIDGERALDVYSSFLGDKASQLPSIGVEYPFALVDDSGLVDTRGIRSGEEYILLRAPMTVDHQTGAVSFAAEVPQGAKIKMSRAKTGEVIEAAREAAKRSMDRLGGKPDAAFFFSCMARKLVLGRRTSQEISVAQDVFGTGTPMIGFYTYGEIANCGETAPMCRFHNETATFLTIREV